MKKASVRFKDTPVAIRSGAEVAKEAGGMSVNTPLLKALALDDSSSMMSDEFDKENSIISSGPSERYNYVGRTPHSKVIEAAKVRKSFEELLKVVPMPMDESNYTAGSPIKFAVDASSNKIQNNFSNPVQFERAPESPALMHTSELSAPGSQELTPNDMSSTGLSNTPSSCSSYNFDMGGSVAEEISAPMPSINDSKERRRPAAHTPFPDTSQRPNLNSKSPENELSHNFWASGSSFTSTQSSPQLAAFPSSASFTNEGAAAQVTPVSVSMHEASHDSGNRQASLSFIVPDYSSVSAGDSLDPNIQHSEVQRSESQLSTPLMMVPGPSQSPATQCSSVSQQQLDAASVNHASSIRSNSQDLAVSNHSSAQQLNNSTPLSGFKNISLNGSMHQISPQMLSGLISQGTPVLIFPSNNFSAEMNATAQTFPQVQILPPATGSQVRFADISSPVSMHWRRVATPAAHMATVSTPSSDVSNQSAMSSSTFPQQPQFGGNCMQSPVVSTVQSAQSMGLPSPMVLAMAGGVALGRGPTAVTFLPSAKPSRPPLPQGKNGQSIQQPAILQAVEPIVGVEQRPQGIAMQSPQRAPATTDSWFTPRNTRKQLPYGAAKPAVSKPVVAVQALASAVKAEFPSSIDMDSLTEPNEVCNVSIQVDSNSIMKTLAVSNRGNMKSDAAVNTSFCSTTSVKCGESNMFSSGYSSLKSRSQEHHQIIKQAANFISPIQYEYEREQGLSECEEGSITSSTYCLEDYLKEANQQIERNQIFYNKSYASGTNSYRSAPALPPTPFNTEIISPSSHLISNNSQHTRHSLKHPSIAMDRTQTTGATVNYLPHQQSPLLTGASKVVNGQAIYSSPASDCSSITLNKSQFPQDLTILTDVAVANYTVDMLDTTHAAMETILEEDSVQSSLPATHQATSVYNNSNLTAGDMTMFLDISQQTNMYPKLAIKSLQKSASPLSHASSVMDIKEVVLQAAPAEVTTVMLTFSNRKNKPIALKTNAICVRFDMISRSMDNQNVDNSVVFGVSPKKMVIPAHGEEVLFISFTPHAGMEGVYTGAMQIKDTKKTFTMLLRGEAYSEHSVQNSPASTLSTPNGEVKSSPTVSTIAKQHASPAQNFTLSAMSKHSGQTAQTTATEKSGFSEKLKALHEKVAEISRSVLYHDASQQLISPQAKYNASVGIASSPCSFTIEKKASSNSSALLVKGVFTLHSHYSRPKVIRCKVNDPRLYRLSTNLVILYPNREQSVSLSVNEGHEEDFLLYARSLYDNSRGNPLQDTTLAEIAVQYDDQHLTVPVTISRSDLLLLFGSVYELKPKPTPSIPQAVRSIAPTTKPPIPAIGIAENNNSVLSTSTKRKEGLYFRKSGVDFGTVSVGTLVRGKIELCNASEQTLVVYIGDLKLPFILNHTEVQIKPRSYVKVPVRFLPVHAGGYSQEMIAQTSDGQETALIALTGAAVSSSVV